MAPISGMYSSQGLLITFKKQVPMSLSANDLSAHDLSAHASFPCATSDDVIEGHMTEVQIAAHAWGTANQVLFHAGKSTP